MPLLRFQPASRLADISDELVHQKKKFCDAGTVVVGTATVTHGQVTPSEQIFWS